MASTTRDKIVSGICLLTASIGGSFLGDKGGYDRGRQEAAPIFQDFTGDKKPDIKLKYNSGNLVCLVSNGDGTYQRAKFVERGGMVTCATDKGFYDPLTGRFEEDNKTPQP